MIQKTNLDTKKPVGNGITTPVYQDGTVIVSTKSADMKNSGTDLNQTASSHNQSAKFKYPNVRQEIPEAGRNQYQ